MDLTFHMHNYNEMMTSRISANFYHNFVNLKEEEEEILRVRLQLHSQLRVQQIPLLVLKGMIYDKQFWLH